MWVVARGEHTDKFHAAKNYQMGANVLETRTREKLQKQLTTELAMEFKNPTFAGLDQAKLARMLEIKESYAQGNLTLEAARQRMREEVGPISPEEFAAAEQMLMREDHDECRNEDIRNILELFDGLVGPERPNLPQGHPIDAYLRENDRARAILSECDRILTHKYIPNALLEQIEALMGYRLHWARKQNQLYSALEREGFDRPSIHMWTYDDEVRDKVKETLSLLQSNADELQVRNAYRQMANDLRDLMVKEETILFPTALKLLSDEKFEAMKHGDQEIGFFGIEMPKAPAATSAQPNPDGLASELAALLGKYGLAGASPTGEMHVAEGMLTLEQINLIYKHLPVDLSYVDENELVRFYSDTTHRVFPRSKGVIGREVRNCHPPKSVHIVEEIIQKFRTGEQSRAEFWINKPEVFIYIVYVAVRDENGKFRGVLEMMQDCTHIRSLTDSRTLLTWDDEQRADETPEANAPANVDTITASTRLADLLAAYPKLKKDLVKINGKFAMLNSPMGKIVIPRSTVQTMSERSGMPLDELIAALGKLIAGYQSAQ